MFGDKDGTSQRRRREDQQVELRRQRTEELLKKKRESAQKMQNLSPFMEYHSRLVSNDLEELYKAAFECRNKLSVENNPPINDIVHAGLVDRFVELLQPAAYNHFLSGPNPEANLQSTKQLINKTRIEAAWVITNIASGSSEQTETVTKAGATPHLVGMLTESDDGIVDQSVWALGNIAGDKELTRDLVLQLNTLSIVVGLIDRYRNSKSNIKILRNLVWLLSNLSRGRNPPPPIADLSTTFQCVRSLIHIDDPEIVADCCWCLSYIADVSPELTDELIRSDIISRCYSILSSFVASLRYKSASTFNTSLQPVDSTLSRIGAHAVCPIIRMLGNITTGTDEATNVVVFSGCLDLLYDIFYFYENRKQPRIRKEICWLLSNVAAGTEDQRRAIIESNLLKMLIDALMHYELYIRKEALFAITNLLYFCAKSAFGHKNLSAFLEGRIVEALHAYLMASSNLPEMQLQTLDAIRYALDAGSRIQTETGENPVVAAMVESGLADDLENLQIGGEGDSGEISRRAYGIIIDFFDGVVE